MPTAWAQLTHSSAAHCGAMNAREQGIRSAAVITAALALVGVGGAVAVAAVVSHSNHATTTSTSDSQLSTGTEPMARTGGS